MTDNGGRSDSNMHTLKGLLADILGFEDEDSVMLDHLLTIDSKEDLLEYLSQLLGDDVKSDGVQRFVDAVVTVQRGGVLPSASVGQASPSQKPAATSAPLSEPNPNNNQQRQQKQQQQKSSRSKSPRNPQSKKQDKSRIPPPKKKQQQQHQQQPSQKHTKALSSAATAKAPSPAPASESEQRAFSSASADLSSGAASSASSDAASATTNSKPKFQLPTKLTGTPTIVCGCFGGVHDALTNCVTCGRISCIREGYDYCAFCGNFVPPVDLESIRNTLSDAWQLKEKLLMYDRQHTQRTKVWDDQADFQGDSADMWISRERAEAASEARTKQLESLRHRPNQQLSLAGL